MVDIYESPECASCHDRGFVRLPDGTIVCNHCRDKILYLNNVTNQEYSRCIEALQKTALPETGDQNEARAVDWLNRQAKEKETGKPMKTFTHFFTEVLEERKRQDIKWGEQNHTDLEWLAIVLEEVGECAKAILEKSNLREELVQVVAVIVAWDECRERNGRE